jgi:hypothetical protein
MNQIVQIHMHRQSFVYANSNRLDQREMIHHDLVSSLDTLRRILGDTLFPGDTFRTRILFVLCLIAGLNRPTALSVEP